MNQAMKRSKGGTSGLTADTDKGSLLRAYPRKDMFDVLVGNVIKRRRQALMISQEQLALKSKIHRTYVSQLERGLKSPTTATLYALARALGTQPSSILLEAEGDLAKE
jgi:ribosome-binding protein aMBF1 (putative translation factor)